MRTCKTKSRTKIHKNKRAVKSKSGRYYRKMDFIGETCIYECNECCETENRYFPCTFETYLYSGEPLIFHCPITATKCDFIELKEVDK